MADLKNAAVDAAEKRRAAIQRQNEEAERQMSASQPTPTQEENDLAKLGALNTGLASGTTPAPQAGTSASTNEPLATSESGAAVGGTAQKGETRELAAAGDTATYTTRAAKKD